MKFSLNRALSLAVISSVVLLVVTSCSKSNNNSSSTSMSATINGSAWAASIATQGAFSVAQSEFAIGGVQIKSGDSTEFVVGFGSPVTLNKALTADGAIVDVIYVDAKTLAFYDGSPASGNGHAIVTVTSYDSTGHKVAGTFSGVLYNQQNSNDSLVIAGGKFSSNFAVQ